MTCLGSFQPKLKIRLENVSQKPSKFIVFKSNLPPLYKLFLPFPIVHFPQGATACSTVLFASSAVRRRKNIFSALICAVSSAENIFSVRLYALCKKKVCSALLCAVCCRKMFAAYFQGLYTAVAVAGGGSESIHFRIPKKIPPLWKRPKYKK